MNPFKLGLLNAGIHKCARILVGPSTGLYVTDLVQGGFATFAYFLPVSGIWVVDDFFAGVGTRRFPYGYTVEPP